MVEKLGRHNALDDEYFLEIFLQDLDLTRPEFVYLDPQKYVVTIIMSQTFVPTSQLSGSHGEWTCEDDLADRRRNDRNVEAQNRLRVQREARNRRNARAGQARRDRKSVV